MIVPMTSWEERKTLKNREVLSKAHLVVTDLSQGMDLLTQRRSHAVGFVFLFGLWFSPLSLTPLNPWYDILSKMSHLSPEMYILTQTAKWGFLSCFPPFLDHVYATQPNPIFCPSYQELTFFIVLMDFVILNGKTLTGNMETRLILCTF